MKSTKLNAWDIPIVSALRDQRLSQQSTRHDRKAYKSDSSKRQTEIDDTWCSRASLDLYIHRCAVLQHQRRSKRNTLSFYSIMEQHERVLSYESAADKRSMWYQTWSYGLNDRYRGRMCDRKDTSHLRALGWIFTLCFVIVLISSLIYMSVGIMLPLDRACGPDGSFQVYPKDYNIWA